MPRMWAMNRPTLRISMGRSLGPTTISATTPTITKSRIRPSGNMCQGSRASRSPFGPAAGNSANDLIFFGVRMSEGLGGGRRRCRLITLQAVAERADALGGVTHKAGELAAPAEQQKHHDRHDQPVNGAET